MNRDFFKYYQKHPVEFCREFLDVNPWEKQEEILNGLVDHRFVTARSGHGVGKSFVAALVAVTFLYTHPYSRVITTAPTDRQVTKIIWQEVHALHKNLEKKIEPVGELLTKEIRIAPKWFALGFSTDDPNAFQGQHGADLLAIFDEACGIGNDILDAAQGILTAENNRALYIGNPTDPNTFFGKTHRGEIPGYYRVKISCFDSPNVGKNDDGTYYDIKPHPYPGLVTLDWIERQRRVYGEDSNFWKARVLGEFPDSAEDQLIDGSHIAAAMAKGIRLRKILNHLREQDEVLSSEDIRRIVGR